MDIKAKSNDKNILIVMDFAKIDVYHKSFQILHVILHRGPSKSELFSFIGQEKEKNDVYFVIYVYINFIFNFLAHRVSRISIFFLIEEELILRTLPLCHFFGTLLTFTKILILHIISLEVIMDAMGVMEQQHKLLKK